MALTYQDLAGMSQEDVIKRLMEVYGQSPASFTKNTDSYGMVDGISYSGGPEYYTAEGRGADPIYSVDTNRIIGDGDNWEYAKNLDGYRAQLTDAFQTDTNPYGAYYGLFDADGKLKDVDFTQHQMSNGWFSDNAGTIGPLLVAAVGGYGLLEGLGAAPTYGLDPAMAASTGAAEAGSLSSLAPISASVGMTPAEILGMSGSNAATAGGIDYVAGMAPAAAGASTVGTAAGGAAGAMGIAEALGGAKGVATALGAGAGLLSSLTAPDEKTDVKNNKLDPRMDALVFGQGGLLDKYKAELNRGPSAGLQSAYNIASNYLGGKGPSGSFGRPGIMGVNGTPWAR